MIAALAAGVPAQAALGAPGDLLTVRAARAEVRRKPEAGAPVLTQVLASEPVVEIERKGRWIRIGVPGLCTLGWLPAADLVDAGTGPGEPSGRPAAKATSRAGGSPP